MRRRDIPKNKYPKSANFCPSMRNMKLSSNKINNQNGVHMWQFRLRFPKQRLTRQPSPGRTPAHIVVPTARVAVLWLAPTPFPAPSAEPTTFRFYGPATRTSIRCDTRSCRRTDPRPVTGINPGTPLGPIPGLTDFPA